MLGAEPTTRRLAEALWSWALLVAGLLTGLLAVVILVGLIASAALIPLALVGLPLWALFARAEYWLSDQERRRLTAATGQPVPAPVRPRFGWSLSGDGLQAILSRTTWAQAAYWLLVVLLWFPMLLAAALPFWPRLGRWFASIQRGAASRLLASQEGRSPEWLEQVVLSRRRANEAADAERKRIERNLHDGAQQHLLSTALTLGRLKARLSPTADPETLALLEDARRDARVALRELRELARGLYPPVLTDLGLDAALSAVVASCPVPIDLAVDLAERPAPVVEAAMYFTVSEALTNVTKHAAATCATVRIHRQDDWVSLAVMDDGRGGARLTPEGGLGGMRHRLQAMGGDLELDSPLGGPTSLHAWVPCASS